jgi:hypothetical protein
MDASRVLMRPLQRATMGPAASGSVAGPDFSGANHPRAKRVPQIVEADPADLGALERCLQGLRERVAVERLARVRIGEDEIVVVLQR